MDRQPAKQPKQYDLASNLRFAPLTTDEALRALLQVRPSDLEAEEAKAQGVAAKIPKKKRTLKKRQGGSS